MKRFVEEARMFLFNEHIDPNNLQKAISHIRELDRLLAGKFRLRPYIDRITETLYAKMEYDDKGYIE